MSYPELPAMLRDCAPINDAVSANLMRSAADEIETLRAALEPFASFAENVDADGWTSTIHREQISTWFGPSDFRRASEALSK